MHGTGLIKKMQAGVMFSSYEQISPEKAAAMVELMPPNRRINKTKVKYYALLMRNRQWDENHPQGLVFNQNVRLIDGQHRLQAVIESGVTVQFYCTYNALDKCVLNLDNGLSRTVDQTGQIMGLGTDKLAIAIARALFIRIGQSVVTRNIEGALLLKMFQAHEDSITFAKVRFSNQFIAYAPIRAIIARAHYQALNNPESVAYGRISSLTKFIEVLDTGFAESLLDSPIIALRNAYLSSKTKSGSSEKVKLIFAGKTITALQKYLKLEPSKLIKESKTQPFTIPEDNE